MTGRASPCTLPAMASRTAAAALAFTLAPLRVLAAPPQPTKAEKLCDAIGQTTVIAIQPRDRLHLEESCVCILGECASKGGARAKWLARQALEVMRRVEEAARREKEAARVRARVCPSLMIAAADAADADRTAQATTQIALEAWKACELTHAAGQGACQDKEAAWRSAAAKSDATATALQEAEGKAREADCR